MDEEEEVFESIERRDLVWIRFSVTEARGEGFSILDSGGRRDLISTPNYLLCCICSNRFVIFEISSCCLKCFALVKFSCSVICFLTILL